MRRYVCLGVALGFVLTFIGGIFALPACYDLPRPVCGFRCGALGECPEDYTCGDDSRCHLNGSAPMVCGTPDAPDLDAAVDVIDGPPDTPDDAIDAPPDAEIDAAIDAAVDAPADADIDAPADAPDDAPPD